MTMLAAVHRRLADGLLKNAAISTRQAPDLVLNFRAQTPTPEESTQILRAVAATQREIALEALAAMRGADQTEAMRGAADDVERAVAQLTRAAGHVDHNRLRSAYGHGQHFLEMAHVRRVAASEGTGGKKIRDSLQIEDTTIHNLRILAAAVGGPTPEDRVAWMVRALSNANG